jgi:hypothetical protein
MRGHRTEIRMCDLSVCDDGTLVKLICFWTLSVVLALRIDWTKLSRCYLKTEAESSLRNVVFWKVNRTVCFR